MVPLRRIFVKIGQLKFFKRIDVCYLRFMSAIPTAIDQMTFLGSTSTPKGLILGLYCDPKDKNGMLMEFTESGKKFDKYVEGKLKSLIKKTLPPPTLGQVRIYYGVEETFNAIAVVGMGTYCVGYNPEEEIDEHKEAIRTAVGVGVKALQELNLQKIYIDSFGHAESAAEGAALSIWIYQEQRSNKKLLPKLELYDSCDTLKWKIGIEKANAQNLARQLMESAANILTPTQFTLNAVQVLTDAGLNVEAKVHKWAMLRGFDAFLAVANGCQPPIFLEASYEGCNPEIEPIILIGKGVTFNAGGICLKKCNDVKHIRGDMSGAAAVVATLKAISSLKIPINVRGLMPLCENMPGVNAYYPGDIIKAQNNKHIEIKDTSLEGRLILADALCHSGYYNPKFIVIVGSLSEEVEAAMGCTASGVFTNSDQLYDMLRTASIHTGDRVWRLPLWDHFTEAVTMTSSSDLITLERNSSGGAGNSAAFLRKFVPDNCDWMLIDCYSVVKASGDELYLRDGTMSGRPTRTLIEFLSQIACRG